MSQIDNTIVKFTEILSGYDIPDPKNEIEILLSHFLNVSKAELYLRSNDTIDDKTLMMLENAVSERTTRKPLQYIIGNVPFLNTTIHVNENVLIPRPETEYMVDLVLRQTASIDTEIQILDLCTGSGAIAISLKKNLPNAKIYASDICEKALYTAKNNAQINNVEINFIKSDLFGIPNSEFRIKYDITISNPPYISPDVYTTLQPEIYFEPKIAFVSDHDGLYFYEKIISDAKDFMQPNSTLYLEIGENQTKSILSLAKKHEYKNIDVYKDLCKKDRIVRLKI